TSVVESAGGARCAILDECRRREDRHTQRCAMDTVAYRVMNGLSALYGGARRLVPEPLKTVDGMVNRVLTHTRRGMPYDDRTATFLGGEFENLTALNYEKALRNLWKAGVVAPELGIRDASPEDLEVAAAGADGDAAEVMERVRSATFREHILDTFSPEQRVALARLFSIVVHGEAYALFVAASLIPAMKGTGSKLGLSLHVLEE